MKAPRAQGLFPLGCPDLPYSRAACKVFRNDYRDKEWKQITHLATWTRILTQVQCLVHMGGFPKVYETSLKFFDLFFTISFHSFISPFRLSNSSPVTSLLFFSSFLAKRDVAVESTIPFPSSRPKKLRACCFTFLFVFTHFNGTKKNFFFCPF